MSRRSSRSVAISGGSGGSGGGGGGAMGGNGGHAAAGAADNGSGAGGGSGGGGGGGGGGASGGGGSRRGASAATAPGDHKEKAPAGEAFQSIASALTQMQETMQTMNLRMRRTDKAVRSVGQRLNLHGRIMQKIQKRMSVLERALHSSVDRERGFMARGAASCHDGGGGASGRLLAASDSAYRLTPCSSHHRYLEHAHAHCHGQAHGHAHGHAHGARQHSLSRSMSSTVTAYSGRGHFQSSPSGALSGSTRGRPASLLSRSLSCAGGVLGVGAGASSVRLASRHGRASSPAPPASPLAARSARSSHSRPALPGSRSLSCGRGGAGRGGSARPSVSRLAFAAPRPSGSWAGAAPQAACGPAFPRARAPLSVVHRSASTSGYSAAAAAAAGYGPAGAGHGLHARSVSSTGSLYAPQRSASGSSVQRQPHATFASRATTPAGGFARPAPVTPRAVCSAAGLRPAPGEAARLNSLGKNLLNAAQEGRTAAVRNLLDAGADPNFTYGSEWTPLHRAAAKSHADVVSLLLKRGANVIAKTSGFTALHMAAYYDLSGRCVTLLVDAGSDVNCGNQFWRTPLHYAAEAGNEAAVRALVAAGANKSARDNEGKTPMDVAKNHCVRRLLALYCGRG